MSEPVPDAFARPGAGRFVGPAALPAVVLCAGRWAHAHGMAGSVGDTMAVAALSGLALGAAFVARGHRTIAGTALGLSGGLAAAAVAGYSRSLALPAIVWAVGTVAGCTLAALGWIADRRTYWGRQHELSIEQLRAETARYGMDREAETTVSVAQIHADAHVRGIEVQATALIALGATHPLLALSQTAREALEPRQAPPELTPAPVIPGGPLESSQVGGGAPSAGRQAQISRNRRSEVFDWAAEDERPTLTTPR
jgi:hypothetical protein